MRNDTHEFFLSNFCQQYTKKFQLKNITVLFGSLISHSILPPIPKTSILRPLFYNEVV